MAKNKNTLIPEGNIESIDIQQEMQQSYLDYAMSVIVARALPDVRDGLKPVHRRILYAMKEGGYDSSKPYRKSARIVGDVMGKYHPHGDKAIYDSMVRMAQDFSLRLPLIDGHGNFGSMDGDSAAAMRYTEARMAKSSEFIVSDLEKNTVDFTTNYDESLKEPTVLPATFPNILVNGSGGIAVGMVTNIPPHNLIEVVNATIALIHNPHLTSIDLMEYIQGPDFPTGGIIKGRSTLQHIYTQGRGSVMMQSKTEKELISNSKREAIIVTEIPYQVNKAKLVEFIAHQVRSKVIEDIAEVRDESNREGVRVVIELKRAASFDIVLNQLFKFTPMQQSFSSHMLALHLGRPMMMSLQQILSAFIGFRDSVVVRRTQFDLDAAKGRAHLLLGLLQAVSHIDLIVQTIRQAEDPSAAKQALLAIKWNIEDVKDYLKLLDDKDIIIQKNTYCFTDRQAKAILELRLQRLTGMERKKIEDELRSLAKDIEYYLSLLENQPLRYNLIENELQHVAKVFGTPRKTLISDEEIMMNPEDFINKEDMVVTFTSSGYIKRVSLESYRIQRRGGKGRMGMSTIDNDTVINVLLANTHTSLLFFSNFGQCYQLKLWQLPLASPQSRGKALVNIFPLKEQEKITALMQVPEDLQDNHTLIFVTNTGSIRRNRFSDFASVRSGGKIAMKLNQNEKLIGVMSTLDHEDILLITSRGLAIRFSVIGIRIFQSRSSVGVRGIKLQHGDEVIGMGILLHSNAVYQDREDYLNALNAKRRIESASVENPASEEDYKKVEKLKSPNLQAMQESEQWILTISSDGYGLLASSYDYRVTSRSGKGIRNMDLHKNATVVGSYLVEVGYEIVIVTSMGSLMRTKVEKMIPKSRGSKGVRMFDLADKDFVISVSVQSASDTENDEDEALETPEE